MASLAILLTTHDGRFQKFRTPAEHIVLGKASGANLRVPLPWIGDRQLEIHNASDVLRIRSLSGDAVVNLLGKNVGDEWVVLSEDSEITVSRDGHCLKIEMRVRHSKGFTVLKGVSPSPERTTPLYTGAIIATHDGQQLQEEPLELPPPLELVPPPRKTHRPLRIAITVTATVVFLVVVSVLVYVIYSDNKQYNRRVTAQKQFYSLIEKAGQQTSDGHYVEAKRDLLEAERIARSFSWEDELAQVQEMCGKPEIQFGANGFQCVHEKWVEPAVAIAWKDAEQQYEPKIAQLVADAKLQIANLQYAGARVSCAEAIAMMDHYPVPAKPHPRLTEITRLDKEAEAKLVATQTTTGVRQ